MALRTDTGEVLTFQACRRYLAHGALAFTRREYPGADVARLDGVCPVHDEDACLETYHSQTRIAGLSLAGWWRLWRRARREVGRG
jgi:hypothetical protein